MSRHFKTVILYLSMLAIPVQGFAASTMLFCGPGHEHTKTARVTNGHLPYGNTDRSSAHHQYQSHAVESSDTVSHASDDEESKFAGSEHAACSVGAAVPASSMRFQPEEPAIERIATTQFPDTGFVTDGPRRPPRSFPA